MKILKIVIIILLVILAVYYVNNIELYSSEQIPMLKTLELASNIEPDSDPESEDQYLPPSNSSCNRDETLLITKTSIMCKNNDTGYLRYIRNTNSSINPIVPPKANTLPVQINTPANSPSILKNTNHLDVRTKIQFKLITTFPTDDQIETVTNQIVSEVAKELLISPDRIQHVKLYPGSIYVILYIYPETNKDIKLYTNNDKSSILLVNALKHIIVNKMSNKDSLLYTADSDYGINVVKDNTSDVPFSSLIPVKNTILDTLINNKLSFALFTKVKNITIPSIDDNPVFEKVYLTIPLAGNISCISNNGMVKLSNTLTQGSVFNLSKVLRNFEYKSSPYKYIDFNRIIYNNKTKVSIIESIFYNLSLKINNQSLTYCQNNCDPSNREGLCTQEVYTDGKPAINITDSDSFNLKNILKLKLESDNSITPYFISLNDSKVERIHFITNNYSTLSEPYNYQTLVQVPIYGQYETYYRKPNYIQGALGSKSVYTYTNVPIANMSPAYTQSELDNYKNLSTYSIAHTLVDNNDAYKDYAFNFHIEIIQDSDYDNLPLN
jgi:hypothetical protein